MRQIHLILVFVLLFVIGCDGPSSVTSTKRTGKYKPTFGVKAKKRKPTPKSVKSISSPIFHRDHFGCVLINVPSLLANTDLQNVPWDSAQTQLSKWVGERNAELPKIERIWVLLDRQGMVAPQSSSKPSRTEPPSPFVFVIDYRETVGAIPVDSDAAATDFRVRQLNNKRLALGPVKQLEQLDNPKDARISELQSQVDQFEMTHDVEAAIVIDPIRSQMTALLGTVSRFMKADQRMATMDSVDAFVSAKMSASLRDSEMLRCEMVIEDDGIVKQVVDLHQSIQANEQLVEMLKGFSGMMGGRGPKNAMFKPRSTSIVQETLFQILKDKLSSVEAGDQKLKLVLRKPKDLSRLIEATIEDSKAQYDLGSRMGKLNKVASALKAYQMQHGFLPPAGPSIDIKDVPNQFNWRIGLLPFLDQQELYDEFKFDQDWNSVANQKVAKKIPDVFACGEGANSRFVAVAGEGRLFKFDATSDVTAIVDAKETTACVVELTAENAVPWSSSNATKLSEKRKGFVSNIGGGFLFINAKWQVSAFSARGNIQALLTSEGKEVIPARDVLPLPKRPE